MTLVFACRGPRGCSEMGYFTASPWKGFRSGEEAYRGDFSAWLFLRRPEPALCDSPRGLLFPCTWTLGRARGTRLPRPQPKSALWEAFAVLCGTSRGEGKMGLISRLKELTPPDHMLTRADTPCQLVD